MGRPVDLWKLGIALITCLAVVTGASHAIGTAYADGMAAKKLNGAEITSVLGGNTVFGKSAKGTIWMEYYAPDGELHGLVNGSTRYLGNWGVKGDQLCATYPQTPASNYCVSIGIFGRSIYYLKDDGTPTEPNNPVTLMKGNPNSL